MKKYFFYIQTHNIFLFKHLTYPNVKLIQLLNLSKYLTYPNIKLIQILNLSKY